MLLSDTTESLTLRENKEQQVGRKAGSKLVRVALEFVLFYSGVFMSEIQNFLRFLVYL